MSAMKTTVLPAGLREEIDKIVRWFLWGGNSNERKIHNVGWSTIFRPKAEGVWEFNQQAWLIRPF